MATGAQFIAMFFLTGVGFLFLFCGATDTDTLENILTGSDFSTCVMVIYSIICITIFSQWYYYSCGGDYRPDRKRTFNPLMILGVIILVPGMQFFSSYLIGIVSMAFPQWLEQYEELIETAGLGSDITPLMLLYSVVLAPIGEELMFRGVTMRQARKAVPFWAANLLQAFLFGVFHLNWIQGIYAFALGLVLGIVCEKGGSIYYSLLFHILFNFWGTVIGELLGDIDDSGIAGLVIFLLMIVFIILGTLLFKVGMKKRTVLIEKLDHNIITSNDDPDHPEVLE
jgi:membrane protease YdiL (CAAX protease family)